MANNPQSRKWVFTINNPHDCGLTQDRIIELFKRLSSLEFLCIADEIATTGTYHTQGFLYSPAPIRFSSLKRLFPTAHFEKAYGTVQENREYVSKTGKWANTEKADTSVEGTYFEWGDIPTEQEEEHPKMYRLMERLRDGATTTEILQESPNWAFQVKNIDILRQTILSERQSSETRLSLEVSYLFGKSGVGKTRSIYQQHKGCEICRITNYRTGKGISFDAYHGQPVLVFEEFCSQIPIEDMLNYLDVYPLFLPARYSDRVACYTTVYITSNLPLEKQYQEAQFDRPETWNAFLRRIHHVSEFLADGTIVDHDPSVYRR